MEEIVNLIIGVLVLVLGIPIGNYLAKMTKEELHKWQKYYQLIIVISGIGSIISLIFWKDYLLFTFLFIAIVTSRSLRIRRK